MMTTSTPHVMAIETNYAGHRFRSRLEARWAVFFDALGIQWTYEQQGYVIGIYDDKRRFLPDFYLPEFDVFVEVKGSNERMDWSLLGVAVDNFSDYRLPDTGRAYSGNPGAGSAVLVLGNIPPSRTHWRHWLVVNQKGARVEAWTWWYRRLRPAIGEVDVGYFDASWGGFDEDFEWNYVEPSVHGAAEDCCCLAPLMEPACNCLAKGEHFSPDPVSRAYDQARIARFEHGETPIAGWSQ